MSHETIFWDVDTQVDFMLPGGKLYVPGAEQILPNLKRLTEYARAHGIPVVADVDAHPPDDPEFALYPPHCIAGTSGQQKVPETQLAGHFVISTEPAELPPNLEDFGQIVLEKQALDVFTNPNTEALLARLRPREIVVYGVFTEHCVRCAAQGLLDRGYRVRLLTDAIYAMDNRPGREFISNFQRQGGELATTDQIIGTARSDHVTGTAR